MNTRKKNHTRRELDLQATAILIMPLLLLDVALLLAGLSDMQEDEIDYQAYTSIQANHLGDADAAFREMVRRDEADAFAYSWLGHIAVRSGNLSAAVSA